MPFKIESEAGEAARPYYFAIAVTCNPPAATTPALAPAPVSLDDDDDDDGDGNGDGGGSGTGPLTDPSAEPPRPSGWPRHLYWAWHKDTGRWREAVHVTWLDWERSDSSEADVELTRAARKKPRVCWVQTVPPNPLPSADWIAPNGDGKIMMPASIIKFVRRTNLLRFRFQSQKL